MNRKLGYIGQAMTLAGLGASYFSVALLMSPAIDLKTSMIAPTAKGEPNYRALTTYAGLALMGVSLLRS